jgi:hypothetical protein
MEQHPKLQSFLSSKTKKTNKQKQIDHDNVDNSDTDTLSSRSTLSIDPNEPLVNDIAHNLFILAVKQAREERRQAKTRQHHKKTATILERQTMLTKKKKLIINDIDRLFEEKRSRPATIKNDLHDLYQKSTGRIRSMLDIRQIDQFIQAKQNRQFV